MRQIRDLLADYDRDPTPFGRLRPLERIGRRNDETIWRFVCTCGNEVEVAMSKVKPSNTQSCGCLKREQSTSRILSHAGWNRLPVAVAGLNMVYRNYRTRARTAGLEFTISIEQFEYLIHQPCYIPNCGAVDSNTHRLNRRDEVFCYNGIDRIDNDRGYVDGNVAPCCRDCNYAKRAMSLNQFFRWLERLRGGNS
jgi:hypothetical protein